MVVFTCNNCGDSVNKPKVEKHIQYECKRKHFAVSFCCVDCLKDFNHETVKSHNQCVTEEERYSAKGFVPKPSSEKGKRKQAGWVDIVQAVINGADLQNDERRFLNIISKFDNVPRKKNKFQNFCFSTAPAYRTKGYLVDKVFDIIEAEYKAQMNQNSNNTTDNLKHNNSVKETSEIKLKGQSDENIKKKNNINNSEETQKKQTNISFKNNEVEETKLDENIEIQSEKKKKKEKKILANNIVLEINDTNVIVSDSTEKSKNNNTSEILGFNDDNIKISNINVIENSVDGTPEIMTESQINAKKKKKIKLQQNNNLDTKDISFEETQLTSSKKSKNKKKKSEVEETNNINENVNNTPSNINNIMNSITNGDIKTELQMSKKEKKEMKKKMKFQHELTSVTNGIIETSKEPIIKKKKRKLSNNEENEEPEQKVLKMEKLPQVPEVQNRRKFEWNEAITQVLQKKKKSMSINKIKKKVLSEYHSLNETTKKTESELEKIFLKKLKKIKNVVINNDKVQLLIID